MKKDVLEYMIKLYNNIVEESLKQAYVVDEQCALDALKKKKKQIFKEYLERLDNAEIEMLESIVQSNAKHLAEGYVNLAKSFLKLNLEACKKKLTKKLTESNVENPADFVDKFIDFAILYESLAYAFDKQVAKQTVKAIEEACKRKKKKTNKKRIDESVQILKKLGLIGG